MGIERKNLSISDRERLCTAIHESGHAIAARFTEHAKKLYKATIVSRGGSLGATYTMPSESDQVSVSKEKLLASIDVAMGGHIAEKLVMGDKNISSGCGSDLQKATDMAKRGIREFGMFGDEGAGFISSNMRDTSDEFTRSVDDKAKLILQESHDRVMKLLKEKEIELKHLSRGLFWYDYLDSDEIEEIINGKDITKPKVREWKGQKYFIEFGKAVSSLTDKRGRDL